MDETIIVSEPSALSLMPQSPRLIPFHCIFHSILHVALLEHLSSALGSCSDSPPVPSAELLLWPPQHSVNRQHLASAALWPPCFRPGLCCCLSCVVHLEGPTQPSHVNYPAYVIEFTPHGQLLTKEDRSQWMNTLSFIPQVDSSEIPSTQFPRGSLKGSYLIAYSSGQLITLFCLSLISWFAPSRSFLVCGITSPKSTYGKPFSQVGFMGNPG